MNSSRTKTPFAEQWHQQDWWPLARPSCSSLLLAPCLCWRGRGSSSLESGEQGLTSPSPLTTHFLPLLSPTTSAFTPHFHPPTPSLLSPHVCCPSFLHHSPHLAPHTYHHHLLPIPLILTTPSSLPPFTLISLHPSLLILTSFNILSLTHPKVPIPPKSWVGVSPTSGQIDVPSICLQMTQLDSSTP